MKNDVQDCLEAKVKHQRFDQRWCWQTRVHTVGPLARLSWSSKRPKTTVLFIAGLSFVLLLMALLLVINGLFQPPVGSNFGNER